MLKIFVHGVPSVSYTHLTSSKVLSDNAEALYEEFVRSVVYKTYEGCDLPLLLFIFNMLYLTVIEYVYPVERYITSYLPRILMKPQFLR